MQRKYILSQKVDNESFKHVEYAKVFNVHLFRVRVYMKSFDEILQIYIKIIAAQ